MSPNATSELFSKLNAMLLRITRRYVNNAADAQDVVQDTLKTILEKQHLCENQRGFVSWCHGVLRNKIGNYYQHRARQQAWVVTARRLQAFVPDYNPDPSESYTAEEQYRKLVHAMEQLDEEYRKVIWLLYSGCEKEEMLKQLCLSNARQLKNKIFRSRKKLRQLMFTNRTL